MRKKRSTFYIPVTDPVEWRSFLAEPEKQWKSGYSAKALAYCWHEANGFPECVRKVFDASKIPLFQDLEILFAVPEYQVPLPPYHAAASQNDIFVLARGNDELVSIMVEGKVSEPFGQTVSEWKKDMSDGKQERLHFLVQALQLQERDLDDIRYQLLHRTASAVVEAKRYHAKHALMLVHSFSQSHEWFEDYERLCSLFGLTGRINALSGPTPLNEVSLYFGWVKGDTKYLAV